MLGRFPEPIEWILEEYGADAVLLRQRGCHELSAAPEPLEAARITISIKQTIEEETNHALRNESLKCLKHYFVKEATYFYALKKQSKFANYWLVKKPQMN